GPRLLAHLFAAICRRLHGVGQYSTPPRPGTHDVGTQSPRGNRVGSGPYLPKHPALLIHDRTGKRHGRRAPPDACQSLGLPATHAIRPSRGAQGPRAGRGAAALRRIGASGGSVRAQPALRLPAAAGDRPGTRHRAQAPDARRAGRRLQPAGEERADAAHPGHPEPGDHGLPHRTRHEGRDGGLGADRRPRLRREDRRGAAAESAHRPTRHRSLPREVGIVSVLLEVERIDVFYGRIQALRGISLHVDEGEIVTLIGANGAGKTTTLRAISGLTPASSGHVRIRGLDITRMQAEDIVTKGIGHAPEGRRIFARMSVRENLDLGAYIRRDGETRHDMERVYTLFPRLRGRQGQLAGTLSGGEQQMLCIGRALMSRPKVLLLDEPSLGLAPLMVDTIFQVIREINSEGTTILLIEQNALKALGV